MVKGKKKQKPNKPKSNPTNPNRRGKNTTHTSVKPIGMNWLPTKKRLMVIDYLTRSEISFQEPWKLFKTNTHCTGTRKQFHWIVFQMPDLALFAQPNSL